MGKRLETKFRISLLYPAPIGVVWSGETMDAVVRALEGMLGDSNVNVEA